MKDTELVVQYNEALHVLADHRSKYSSIVNDEFFKKVEAQLTELDSQKYRKDALDLDSADNFIS